MNRKEKTMNITQLVKCGFSFICEILRGWRRDADRSKLLPGSAAV